MDPVLIFAIASVAAHACILAVAGIRWIRRGGLR